MKLTEEEQDFLIAMLDDSFCRAKNSINEIICDGLEDVTKSVVFNKRLEALLRHVVINEQIVLKFAKTYKERDDSSTLEADALKILKELQRVRRIQFMTKINNGNRQTKPN